MCVSVCGICCRLQFVFFESLFTAAKPCPAVHAWLTQLWTLELQHPDPIGYGLARECFLEPAGPDCIIPGQPKPIRLLGFQVHS